MGSLDGDFEGLLTLMLCVGYGGSEIGESVFGACGRCGGVDAASRTGDVSRSVCERDITTESRRNRKSP